MPFAVTFNLVPSFLNSMGARHFGFMLRGLRELEGELKSRDIPFFLLRGDCTETVPKLANDLGAGLLVTDFSPLRIGRQWRDSVAKNLSPKVPFVEVDAHNIVPVWEASPKLEYAARTIRPKIQAKLPEFLEVCCYSLSS